MLGVIFWLFALIFGGLVIGALGRLVVPGRNPIGFWRTVLCGVAGSVIGGAVAAALFGHPTNHWLIDVIFEVLAAAALVALFSRRRGRYWA